MRVGDGRPVPHPRPKTSVEDALDQGVGAEEPDQGPERLTGPNPVRSAEQYHEQAADDKRPPVARDGGLIPVDVGPLARARQLEGLRYLGITVQQPLGLNFASAWKLLS